MSCMHVCREKQSRVIASSMKKVLLLGAGYVSAPVVEYLTTQGVAVTVGKYDPLIHLLSEYTQRLNKLAKLFSQVNHS